MKLKYTDIQCPHCGHRVHLEIDASNGDQDYYEDCPNCCNPIHLRTHIDELHRQIQLNVDSDDDQIY